MLKKICSHQIQYYNFSIENAVFPRDISGKNSNPAKKCPVISTKNGIGNVKIITISG